jgi:membrane dipeptidase
VQAAGVHRDAIVFDALNVCNWSREIFEAWRAGGVTGVSCTCGMWEDFRGSIANVVQWKKRFEEHRDLLLQVHTAEDIRRAKREGRTGVVLSWQNTAGIEDQLGYLHIFRDLGVRIMQLTYNTQNYSGAGYLELRDSGLTGFGREVLDEMARLGIACDLSHVGPQTTADTIEYAEKPPCFTHVLPAALKDSKRNKTDAELRALAARGGMIGVSLFAPGMRRGNDATIEDVLEAMEHCIAIAGEDHVGLGTDFSQGHPRPGPYLEWANKDKGYARELTAFGHAVVKKPAGVATIQELPNLAPAMERRGWSEARIRKVLGENWLRYLALVWGG